MSGAVAGGIEAGREPLGRLRTLIAFDAVIAVGSGLFTIGASLTVARIPTLTGLGAFVVAVGIAIGSAVRPLDRGDVDGAIARFALANWVEAVVVTAVATFSWPLHLQGALIPVALAASYVSRASLTRYLVGTVVTVTLVACVGLLQDVTGLTDEVPDGLETAVLLLVGPPLAALVVMIALAHHLGLRDALDDEQAARAALAEHAEELRRSRLRVVAATDRARRRIERDLHDGAQSRLVAVNLGLARLRTAVEQDPTAAAELVERARHEVHLAHRELRDLAHGLYPTELTQHGLPTAIAAAADRCGAPVRLDLHDVGRHHPDVEAAVYFCVLEAMQNASRHAAAAVVDVRLDRPDGLLRFQVADDGVGFDPSPSGGHGLTDLADRLGAFGGDVDVRSTLGAGTTVTGTLPTTGR